MKSSLYIGDMNKAHPGGDGANSLGYWKLLTTSVYGRRFLLELIELAVDDVEWDGELREAVLRVVPDELTTGDIHVLCGNEPGWRELAKLYTEKIGSIEPGGLTTARTAQAMEAVVDHAVYWQPPMSAADRMSMNPVFDGVIAQAAALFAESVGASFLAEDWDAEEQWWCYRDLNEAAGFRSQAGWNDWRESVVERENEHKAEAQRSAKPRPFSSTWWTSPGSPATHPMTAVASWEEDSRGESEQWGQLVLHDANAGEFRRYVIDSVADWAELVQRYPLETTYTNRWDWKDSVGAGGRLFAVDFAAMAKDWDAVTVTPRGYLAAAGMPIAVDIPGVDDGGTTMLAGWNPGWTWWLTDNVVVPDVHVLWHEIRHPDSGAPVSGAGWEAGETRSIRRD